MKPTIIVAGSSNTDMVIKTTHIPVPGETVLGGTFFMNAGGKGANQAVAAARLGGHIVFICKTGNDIFGRQAKDAFQKEGIDTSFVTADELHPSGVALITVDKNGENCIVVASGANEQLLPSDIKNAAGKIKTAVVILAQLETPVPSIEYLAELAGKEKIMMVLNPAPAARLSNELLQKITVITPNQKEAEMLTGIAVTDQQSAEQAALQLTAKGIQTVIITMGAQGALLLHKNKFSMIASPKVKAVDTTAAGDVFNGALAVALAEGTAMEAAVSFACRAAAIAVTRLGAQASVPYRNELK
jgi:ribokinase